MRCPIKSYLFVPLALCIVGSLLFCSCIREDKVNNTPEGNFEALWKIIDERYCFFDYKNAEYNLDWDEVHERYRRRISNGMSESGLFEVLGQMLDELRDGHVNLSSAYGFSYYWKWKTGYPANFSDSLQRIYLGSDHQFCSSMPYTIFKNNIGYLYCGSFENGFGDGNLDVMLNNLSFCSGLIVDVRNNSGGMITAAETLASRFTNEKVLIGYMSHKTGTGHSDFSTPEKLYLESSEGVRWQKNVVVLTNRSVYSAANHFVNAMKVLPRVTVIGDYTGGGSGLPFSSMLPNGWSVRFSACPEFDADMNQTEFGIKPDVEVQITSEDMQRGIDTIIETACMMLK